MRIANKISLSFLLTAVVLTSFAATVFYITARKSLEDRIQAAYVEMGLQPPVTAVQGTIDWSSQE